MDTSLLKTFLVIAETRNFTSAAKRLCRSQSAISLQIVRLESLLGKPLLIRDKRSVQLSAEGERLRSYAYELLRLEEELLALFTKTELSGSIRFGTPEDLATAYLPAILASFSKSYPKISLDVGCEFTVNLMRGYEAGIYDLILIKQDPQNPYPRSQPIWMESLAWVASAAQPQDYLEHHRMQSVPLIVSPSPCVYRQRALMALDSNRIKYRIVYTSPSLAGTVAAVKAGLGIAVLPVNMIQKGLKIIPSLPGLQEAQIALMRGEKSSEAVDRLAEYIVEHILSESLMYRHQNKDV